MGNYPGFILLSRDLLDKSIFAEPDMLKLWIYILLRPSSFLGGVFFLEKGPEKTPASYNNHYVNLGNI